MINIRRFGKNFKGKEELRKKQIDLPIEEKITILVHFQEIANEAASVTGRRKSRHVWPLSSY